MSEDDRIPSFEQPIPVDIEDEMKRSDLDYTMSNKVELWTRSPK
jgi:hypothetical protein